MKIQVWDAEKNKLGSWLTMDFFQIKVSPKILIAQKLWRHRNETVFYFRNNVNQSLIQLDVYS